MSLNVELDNALYTRGRHRIRARAFLFIYNLEDELDHKLMMNSMKKNVGAKAFFQKCLFKM